MCVRARYFCVHAVTRRYPLWKQYSYKWASETIVRKTIGEVGCLVSTACVREKCARVCERVRVCVSRCVYLREYECARLSLCVYVCADGQ